MMFLKIFHEESFYLFIWILIFSYLPRIQMQKILLNSYLLTENLSINQSYQYNESTSYNWNPRSQPNCSSYQTCYSCNSINSCFWCNFHCDLYNNTSCFVDFNNYVLDVEFSNYWFNNFYNKCIPDESKCKAKIIDLNLLNLNDSGFSLSMDDILEKNETCYWQINNNQNKAFSYILYHDSFNKDRVSIRYQSKQNNQLYNSQSSTTELINDTNITISSITIFYQNIEYPHSTKFNFSIEILSSSNILNSSNTNRSATRIDRLIYSEKEKGEEKEEEEEEGEKKVSITLIIAIVFSILAGICLIFFAIRFIYLKCQDDFLNANENNANLQAESDKNNIKDANILLKNFKESSYEECLQFDQLECTICLLSNDGNEKVVSSPCHHFFHYNCIFNWVKRSNSKVTCPNCNFDLLCEKEIPLPEGYKIKEITLPQKNKNETRTKTKKKLKREKIKTELYSPTTNDILVPMSSRRFENSQHSISDTGNNSNPNPNLNKIDIQDQYSE